VNRRIWTALQHDLEDITTKLKNFHTDYKKAKQHADVWRNDFLESLAMAKAKKNGTTVDKERNQLTTMSKQRTQAWNIKRMQRKLRKSATTKVYITGANGTRHECTTKNSVEEAYIHENAARFSQTEGTPAMLSPLLENLGYLASTDHADEILCSTYQIPDDTDHYAGKLIAELRIPDSIRHAGPMCPYVSTKDHMSSWKKQKEGMMTQTALLSASTRQEPRMTTLPSSLQPLGLFRTNIDSSRLRGYLLPMSKF
jgi:hypothetical protein